MKKLFTIHSIILFSLANCMYANAQPVHENHLKAIKERSGLWNTAYNNRDSVTLYTLFDSLAIISTGGSRSIGMEECKILFRSHYIHRPDISWINKISKIEINEPWSIAYETGNWTEAWTEKGDISKSQIKGKYWIMWEFDNGNWFIVSAIFTPLSCTGSYCNK